MLKTNPTTYTIAQYCDMLERRQIIVNNNYQRSAQVWPIAAKSNLIDTILTGYPIPKIILSQKTDLETKKTVMEVVDGQQRTRAIVEFFKGDVKLSRGAYAGNTFDDLEEHQQRDFLDYAISADVFASATEEDIREVFRRINSYQVPLNAQETRHAVWQGEFKWFIHEMGQRYTTAFVKMGTLTEKKVSRMADLEVLTELVQVLVYGIRTASPAALTVLYKTFDVVFAERPGVEAALGETLGYIIGLTEILDTDLLERPNLYSMFAAVASLQSALPHLDPTAFGVPRELNPDRETVVVKLTTLLSQLNADDADRDAKFADFVDACASGTNTMKKRSIRYQWFCRALGMVEL